MIGGPQKIYDFECSSNKIIPYNLNQNSQVLYHTNHPLVNNDYNSEYIYSLEKQDKNSKKSENTYVRFNSLKKSII